MHTRFVLSAFALAIASTTHADPATYALGDIVVTATRTPIPAKEVIGDLTIISQTQIRNAGQTTLVQLLQEQPGLEITQSGGVGTASGIYIRGANANQTLVLVDGLRVGSATLGTTPLENISLDQVDHIEILRGPASSLYGADAIGGVIQIFTKQGKGAPRMSAALGLGSYGTVNGRVGYSGQAGATRFSLGAGYDKTNGGFSAARPGTYGYVPDDDGDRKRNASLSLEHAIDAGNSIGLSGFYNHDRVEYDNGTANDYAINQVNGLSAYWKGHLAGGWQSRILIGQGENLTNNFSNGVSNGRFDTRQTQYQWQNDFTVPLGIVTASLERNEQKVDSTQVFTHTSRSVNAVQVGYVARIGQHGLQASLRHDNYSDFGGYTSGTVGYAYSINPVWKITTTAGTAFKAPTFNDMYYPNIGFYAGNPNLQPEQSRQADVGVRYHEDVNQFGVTAFQNRVRDLITYDTSVFPNTMSNIAEARIRGVEFTGATELAGLKIKASFDWQNPQDHATGNVLVYRAQRHGTLDLSKVFGDLELGTQVIASGKRYINASNTQSLGGYALVNLRARYRLAPAWSVLARVNNALDKDYQLVNGYNTPGLNAFVGVEYNPH
ncbi:MAG: TonB-dependent receptor [Pseudomonadota bacterium]